MCPPNVLLKEDIADSTTIDLLPYPCLFFHIS